MFDLRLKTSVNFDFKKLKNEIPKIAKKLAQASIAESIKATKKSIDDEEHRKPLSKLAIKQRQYGHHPRLKTKKPTTSIKPLRWTDYLYKNIKQMKKGIQIPDYGWYHHTGETWGGVQRKFLKIGTDTKALKETQKLLKKAFKISKKKINEMKF